VETRSFDQMIDAAGYLLTIERRTALEIGEPARSRGVRIVSARTDCAGTRYEQRCCLSHVGGAPWL
jgi:hypothetical protein